MKNKVHKIKLIIGMIITTILVGIILSVTLQANKIGFGSVNLTGEMAHFISYNPTEFMALDVGTIFEKNARINANISGLSPKPYATAKWGNVSDIYYNSAMCMFHTQGNHADENVKVKITNIIDIETPGKYTIYKFTGKIYDWGGLENDHESKEMVITDLGKKKHLTAFAYLISRCSLYEWPDGANEGYINEVDLSEINTDIRRFEYTDNENVLARNKNAIHYLFNKAPESGLKVREIFYESGLLDELFYGQLDYVSDNVYASPNTTSTGANELNSALTKGDNSNVAPELQELTASSEKEVVYSGGNTYIGPFKVKHAGGTIGIEIKGVESSIIKWTTKNADGTFGASKTGNVPTSTNDSNLGEFYVVAEGQKLEDTLGEMVDVKIILSYDIYKARIALGTNKFSNGQNLMFFAGEKTTASKELSWSIKQKQTKDLTIQKQDASGNNLKVEGIVFEIYDSQNQKYATLKTNSEGKTGIVKLKKEEEYVIKETYNGAYGYKNASITDAKITSGEGTTSVSKGEVKIKLTKDSIIAIKNTPQLGNLTIHKTGENSENLEGVEFALWKGGAYLKLNDASVTTPIVTTNSGIDITQYSVTTVNSASQATKFKTNSSGKIVINNLEIYSAKGTKYSYWIYESKNNIYGYELMTMTSDDVTVTGGNKLNVKPAAKQINFDITSSTTVTVANHRELGNIDVEKVGYNSEKLQNVKFVISAGTNQYLQLKNSSNNAVTSITGKATINLKNVANSSEYAIAYTSDKTKATKFITNANGKTGVNNVRLNDASGNKYNYVLQEIENNNYGYELMTMASDDVNITGGEKVEVKSKTKEIKFTITNTAKITISNHRELGNIEVTKTGYNSEKLQNVKFVISAGTNQYLQLKDSSNNVVASIAGIAKINLKNVANSSEYAISYTTDKTKATRFITNAEGKTGVNNVRLNDASGNKYNYVLQEIENNIYGYELMTMTTDDISITGGTKVEVKSETKEIKFTITDTAKITISNNRQLGNLEIHKVGENNENLENVTFIIGASANEYIQLKNDKGEAITTITGTATINLKNTANSKEYAVVYVTDKAKATRFITNTSGKITINNLKVNKSITEKYKYTAHEISNPNYGYGADNSKLTGNVTELKINETSTIKITNSKNLGNLQLVKYDADNKKILLENVGFAVEISPSVSKKYAYIALLDNKGQLVPSVTGTATINNKNTATSDGKEYKVSYYCTDTALTENDKKNITTFITGSDGKLTINNLELYQTDTGSEYTYKLKEIINPYYGYDVKSAEISNITLEKGKITTKELGNKQIYTKLSGYVWLENPSGKSDSYDNVFTSNATTAFDKKLIDLYKQGTNGIELNSDAEIPVEIKLYKKDGSLVKNKPDEFNIQTGEYTFVDLVIKDLEQYEVVFEYDGFRYTTIKNGIEDNASKVVETAIEREKLNQKFDKVKDYGEIISKDGSKNKAEYEKQGHASIISNFNFDTKVLANTTNAQYNLKSKFEEIKSASTKTIERINNTNMGIVLREQPKLALGSDIYSVYIDVNQKGYTYYYNGRQNHYDNLNSDEVGVKFEQENSKNRYTRTVYSSDVEALTNGSATMNVSITYKIRLFNQSRTLTSVVKEIENYFDSRYTIEAIGTSFEEVNAAEKDRTSNFTIEETKTNVDVELGEGVNAADGAYTAVRIKLNNGIELKAKEKKDIYIKFKLSKDAIKGLLNGESTYHNASEIMSYTTYYGSETQKIDGKQFITEQGKAGELYAGIDKSSQPGNAKLKLVKSSNQQGTTPVLDITEFEDDTTSAPSLLLEAVESRKISGTIFEDKATNANLKNNEKLGDGIYNEGEKPIAGVVVELLKVSDDGTIGDIARYSDATKYYEGTEAKTTTDENGNYTLGYYDETNKKFVGILPGRYVIKYTYNNESYIVGGNKINVNDYKSTIITSDVIKSAISNKEITYNNVKYSSERWYTIEEPNRYSDAIDSLELRKTIDEDIATYATYKDSASDNYVMEAYTPVMEIGIEFTGKDAAEALTLELVKELKNIDFGIIERPDIKITVEKQITSLEITAQNGASIVPKGNPSNPDEQMQYVKTGLDGVVYAEIESQLLQGAKLNVEYTITAKNNGQIDYIDDDYYLYGKNGVTLRKIKLSKLADYLDNSMTVVSEQLEEGTWTETSAKELYDNGFISEEVRKQLEEGEYHILTTEKFAEIQPGEEGKIKLYATKFLASSDIIAESNHVEIIELEGGRTIEESIPGNYDPENSKLESDGDKVDLIITSPTGTTINYVLYIGAAVATFVILVIGIVIIKKRIIK